MRWSSIQYFKQHSRIMDDCEDALLELYGESAESTILEILNRTYEDILENYGEVPVPIRHATLMLVEASYQHRSPVSQTNLSIVPYSVDLMLKPYMRLTSGGTSTCTMQIVTLGSEIKIDVSADLPDGLIMRDVDFNVTIYNQNDIEKKKQYTKEECLITDDGSYVVLLDTDELGIGQYMVKVVFQIPDTDFPDELRKEVVRINPHILVKG